jgi:hypothetical protein
VLQHLYDRSDSSQFDSKKKNGLRTCTVPRGSCVVIPLWLFPISRLWARIKLTLAFGTRGLGLGRWWWWRRRHRFGQRTPLDRWTLRGRDGDPTTRCRRGNAGGSRNPGMGRTGRRGRTRWGRPVRPVKLPFFRIQSRAQKGKCRHPLARLEGHFRSSFNLRIDTF